MSKNYLAYEFFITPVEPWSEIVLATLSDYGFESFEMTSSGLKAYAPKGQIKNNLELSALLEYQKEITINYEIKEIPAQNWNATWESDFQPVVINETCVIRAPFHHSFEVAYELIISPKMSFGTGHHETTFLMVLEMLEMDFSKKTVLDMGCGTGILGILAMKKGASAVDAIDADAWCVENALENCKQNNCEQIQVCHATEAPKGTRTYDCILANINTNVLLSQLKSYARILKPQGTLLLSGFYEEDLPIMTQACEKHGFELMAKRRKHNWIVVKFHKHA